MMSNNEDCSFQCQEQGHITRNFPNIRCFECDEYGHIAVDCPHRIPPWEPQQSITNPDHTKATMPGQAPDTAMGTGTGKFIPGHNHVSTDTAAQVDMIHIEAIPDHNIGTIASTTGVAYNAQIPHTGVINHQSCCDSPHRPHCRSSACSSSYHSKDRSHSHSCPCPSCKSSQ